MNKIKVLNEKDIKELIDLKIAINAVEKAYAQKSDFKGSVWPMVFYEYEHNVFDLDIRSGNLDDSNAYGLKLISYNENNVRKGLDKVNATSLVFDSTTGCPLALLNASPITSYRTGAAAAIGAKYLARKNSENLLVVGCGNVAIYSIAAVLITMPSIKNVVICNPKNYESAFLRISTIKEEVNRLLGEVDYCLQAEISCADDIESAVKSSDIIITATPSEVSMIKADWVKEGTHFSCMGAGMEGKQEIDHNLFQMARSFADDEKQCIKSGEAQRAFREGIISKFNGEIGEVILGRKEGRTNDSQITIFDSTGLFIQDLATSIEVLKKADEVRCGIEVEI